jgi:hypothetical protein
MRRCLFRQLHAADMAERLRNVPARAVLVGLA